MFCPYYIDKNAKNVYKIRPPGGDPKSDLGKFPIYFLILGPYFQILIFGSKWSGATGREGEIQYIE